MFQPPSDKKDPMDGEYIGNIWGWKFSFIGLGLIVFMLGIMLYRHYTMDVPLNEGFEIETPMQRDSL